MSSYRTCKHLWGSGPQVGVADVFSTEVGNTLPLYCAIITPAVTVSNIMRSKPSSRGRYVLQGIQLPQCVVVIQGQLIAGFLFPNVGIFTDADRLGNYSARVSSTRLLCQLCSHTTLNYWLSVQSGLSPRQAVNITYRWKDRSVSRNLLLT